jgi:3-isopropylmalate/(R)-2-methylmalate dehydratase small subunit
MRRKEEMSGQKTIRGKAYILGDDIDTDQIIPAEHLVYNLDDEEESKKYGAYALSGVPFQAAGLPEGGTPFVTEGNWQSRFQIIIGGKNFGCGSSREHAPFALNKAGIQAVVATSYARIFYRNSINGGYLVPATSEQDLSKVYRTGDEVEIDVDQGKIRNITQGLEHSLLPLGDVAEIIKAGNVFEYAKQMGMTVSA